MKLMNTLALVSLLASCVAEDWNTFKLTYNKVYSSPSEELTKLSVFEANRNWVEQHNERFEQGLETFKVAMNQFGDLTDNEFRILYLKTSNTDSLKAAYIKDSLESTYETQLLKYTVPEAMNWTKLGAVTSVKNQGHCGACWAFSAAGALEGQIFRKTGNLVVLSEQNLIDCSSNFGNKGCHGGMPYRALRYIKMYGVPTEESYPYVGEKRNCQNVSINHETKVKKFAFLRSKSDIENNLKKAVAIIGPISSCLWASKSFRFYSEGIFYDEECISNDSINHAVLIVGYGNENGTDYWLVKNSWGKNWGEYGYGKISRNLQNHCNVASHCVFPII